MARKPVEKREPTSSSASSSVEELLLAALERGDESLETGRYLITYKDAAVEEGVQSMRAEGMRIADTRDFTDQAADLESVGDADAVVFPEIGVALVGGEAAEARGMSAFAELASDSAIESVDPEYFMFALSTQTAYMGGYGHNALLDASDFPARGFAGAGEINSSEYLRGFSRAVEIITADLRGLGQRPMEDEVQALVLGATWGMVACRVPPSTRSGAGIKVAVLDTGMDLGHPDFAGRPVVSQQFVGQPVQDLNGHGTHCIGTSCGPQSPAGNTPRYGIGFRASIFAGKVLTNSGSGSMAGVLNGMNWAIANRCQVISMSLGAQVGVQPAYTAAGNAALGNGLLIVAAAGNAGSNTGAPANSPSIMSVASLDKTLSPSSFSNFGKVDIAAPGRDIFSSWPRPTRYNTISGTSMATPHVAGCAALWAESSASLRGLSLWRKLQTSARALPFPPARVGAGLVQAP